ncbi:MAG: histidine--tRNA ligase [Verrucomicrobium sp.]|nr:histidine--tRNA ligase [Verrucomicrobium sp.]
MQSLPGFRDFYPEDFAFRHALVSRWRKTARRYGFVEYDGPPLEPLELYQKKSGDELVGQLYHFVDKGERAVALRAEMTPTLARMVAARHQQLRKPLKWFSIPQVFRYERTQKGRLREHFQLNCDILGEGGTEADVELIALLIDTLRGLGLTEEDFVIRLSDRRFWTDFLTARAVPEKDWYEVFQAIDKSEREPKEKIAERLASVGLKPEEVFDVLENGAAWQPLSDISAGLAARGLGGYAKVDFRIVRGLAYYTGVVFEAFDRKGAFRAIAGGGRYDDLLSKLGDAPLPAIGFGMGDVVLTDLLKERGLLSEAPASCDVYVVVPDEAYRPAALGLVQELREAGWSVDYSLSPDAKVRKQFEAAEQRGARCAVIVDAKTEQGLVEVKDLAARTQKEVPRASLREALPPPALLP